MDKRTIIDYVTKTPLNTNKAILDEMLDALIAQNGGGEGGITPPPLPPELPSPEQTVIFDGGKEA